MGFQLPTIPSVKLPGLTLDSAMSALTATFDPSATVSQVTSNINAQQSAIEAVRAQLETIRKQKQQATAASDFASLQKYTAGMNSMTDAACIMASVKPALTPMTPNTLTNPLGSANNGVNLPIDTSAISAIAGGELSRLDPLGGVSKELVNNPALVELAANQLGVDSTIVNAALSGDINKLASPDTLSSLAVSGAGMYVSGLTGGLIPPSVCSSVINQVAGQAINSAISGTLTGDPSAVLAAANKLNPNISPSGVLSSIAADYTGGMLEGASSQVLSKAFDGLSGNSFGNLTATSYVNLGTTMLNNLNPDGYSGMIGGINYGNAGSFIQGLAVSGLKASSVYGNIPALWDAAELLDNYQMPKSTYKQYVHDAASTICQTPNNIELYKKLYTSTESAIPNTSVSSTSAPSGPVVNILLPKQMYKQDYYDKKMTTITGYKQRAIRSLSVEIDQVVNEYTRYSEYDANEVYAWICTETGSIVYTISEEPVVHDLVYVTNNPVGSGGIITAVSKQSTDIYETGIVDIESCIDEFDDTPSASSDQLRSISGGPTYIRQTLEDIESKYSRYHWYNDGSNTWICYDTITDAWRYVNWESDLDAIYAFRDIVQVLEIDQRDDLYEGNSDIVNNSVVQAGGRLSEVVLGNDTARKLQSANNTANLIRSGRSLVSIDDAFAMAY